MRHAARARAGPRQAGRGARAARAAAPARGAAADGARLGDRAATRARRLRRARRRARPKRPRGGRRAQRRASRAASRSPRPTGRRGHARVLAAVGGSAGAVADRPDAQEVSWSVPLDEDDEHTTMTRPGRRLLRRRHPRGAGARGFPRPVPRPVTPVNAWWGSFDLAVNLFSGLPAEPPSRTSSCATRWTSRRSPWAGGPATPATGRRRSTPTRTRRRRTSRRQRSRRRPRAGTRLSASTSWTGRHPLQSRPARGRARVRPLGVPPRVHVCEWDPALLASAEGQPPPIT